MFSNTNRFRRGIVKLITHKRFDQGIVFLIAVNSLLLGLKDYTDTHDQTYINQFLETSDKFFIAAFTIECVLKIIGMGFICG